MGKLGRRVRHLLMGVYNDGAGGDEGDGRISKANVRPPWVLLTIHINMDDLLPGTIRLTPRYPHPSSSYGGGLSGSSSSSSSGGENQTTDLDFPISLPKFTLFTADTEVTSIMVRNEADSAIVEVYNIRSKISMPTPDGIGRVVLSKIQ